MEVPQYTLRPNTHAMVAPWILKLLGLAIIFYVGIFINVKLMWKISIPPFINIFIFLFLGVLVAVQVILYRVKFGKYKYMFFTNRIEFDGKKLETFLFDDIQQTVTKHKLFEKMFDTGEIILGKDFKIGPISNVSQVKNYLDQLVQYHRATAQKYRAQQQQASMQQSLAARQPQQQYQQYRPQAAAQQPQPRPQPQQQPQSQQQSQPSSGQGSAQPGSQQGYQQQGGAQ